MPFLFNFLALLPALLAFAGVQATNLDNTDNVLTYTGEWYHNDLESFSNTANAAITVDFHNLVSVEIHSARKADRGYFGLYLNDTLLYTCDAYNPSTTASEGICYLNDIDKATLGTLTLRIQNLGFDSRINAVPYLALDYIVYTTRSSASTPASIPVSTPVSTPVSHPISTPVSTPVVVTTPATTTPAVTTPATSPSTTPHAGSTTTTTPAAASTVTVKNPCLMEEFFSYCANGNCVSQGNGYSCKEYIKCDSPSGCIADPYDSTKQLVCDGTTVGSSSSLGSAQKAASCTCTTLTNAAGTTICPGTAALAKGGSSSPGAKTRTSNALLMVAMLAGGAALAQ